MTVVIFVVGVRIMFAGEQRASVVVIMLQVLLLSGCGPVGAVEEDSVRLAALLVRLDPVPEAQDPLGEAVGRHAQQALQDCLGRVHRNRHRRRLHPSF